MFVQILYYAIVISGALSLALFLTCLICRIDRPNRRKETPMRHTKLVARRHDAKASGSARGIHHEKTQPLLRCIAAAVISLTLILSLSACGQDSADTGGSTPSGSDLVQTETALNGESLLEAVFTQNFVGSEGRITYYRDKTTDVLYMKYYYYTGNAGMGGLTIMLDPDTGKPLTYTRYMEQFSALHN